MNNIIGTLLTKASNTSMVNTTSVVNATSVVNVTPRVEVNVTRLLSLLRSIFHKPNYMTPPLTRKEDIEINCSPKESLFQKVFKAKSPETYERQSHLYCIFFQPIQGHGDVMVDMDIKLSAKVHKGPVEDTYSDLKIELHLHFHPDDTLRTQPDVVITYKREGDKERYSSLYRAWSDSRIFETLLHNAIQEGQPIPKHFNTLSFAEP